MPTIPAMVAEMALAHKVGTATEQLYVAEGDRWTGFGHNQGLPQNTPVRLFDDSRGYLWVVGLRGIYRVPLDDLRRNVRGEPAALRAEVYGNEFAVRSTGPRAECCNGTGNSKGFLDKGSMWLPTRDGVLVVPTEAMARNSVPPTVRIESVNAGEAWVSVDRFFEASLPARVRDLSFKFSALSFQDPNAVQLQYRLRGYDADWFREALKDKGIKPCIPGRKSRGNLIKHDKRLYPSRALRNCQSRLRRVLSAHYLLPALTPA